MKRYLSKVLLVCLCLLSVNCTMVLADEIVDNDANIAAEETVEPRAISTGYYYMKINGVCYRRLWNYTEGVWIDDAWSPCPDKTHNH